MVKGKRNGLTFTECLVKICRFLLLPPSFRKWSYHNTTQSECAHRLVQTFSLVMSRPKCPASLSKWQAFSDLLLLVSTVNPSFKLTVFMAYEKQHTIFQNELLDFLTWISFLIFEKSMRYSLSRRKWKTSLCAFVSAIADGRNRESIDKVELTLFAVCEANEFRCGAHSNNNINYSVPITRSTHMNFSLLRRLISASKRLSV